MGRRNGDSKKRRADLLMLNNGECFIIDGCRDGQAIIERGREGERALLAFPTSDDSWPDFHPNMHLVNVVLWQPSR